MVKAFSLYFHLPFCTKKCPYCHFYVLPDKQAFKEQLLQGLELEWQLWKPQLQKGQLVSVYFGGGTPFLFGSERIAKILSWLPQITQETEITLEANPEDIDFKKMEAFKKVGVNRVSIGLQSLDDAQLKKLGRLHTAQKAIDAVEITAATGISNISVDLMYDLPHQTLSSWEKSLEALRNLPVTHLSLYNLTIEPHTVFFKFRKNIEKELPDPETSLEMYELARAKLAGFGLMQYEISAFAKSNFYSRHNTGYWTGRPFLGFGPSAFSYWQDKRFRNVANLSRYHKSLLEGISPIDFEEKLEGEAKQRELLAINLRLLEGVNLLDFQKEHGPLSDGLTSDLDNLIAKAFLKTEKKQIKLTHKGILFYDTVATEII